MDETKMMEFVGTRSRGRRRAARRRDGRDRRPARAVPGDARRGATHAGRARRADRHRRALRARVAERAGRARLRDLRRRRHVRPARRARGAAHRRDQPGLRDRRLRDRARLGVLDRRDHRAVPNRRGIRVGCPRPTRPTAAANGSSGPATSTNLATAWIPALDGVAGQARRGRSRRRRRLRSRRLDASCSPRPTRPRHVVGFDAHDGSIDAARKRAADAGLADRVRFEVAPATGYRPAPTT